MGKLGATHSVGEDRRVEAVHHMPDQLLCATIVHLLLTAIVVEYPVKAKPNVLDLLAHHRERRFGLERGDGVGLGRIEDEDTLVEDLEDLAHASWVVVDGERARWLRSGGRRAIRVEEYRADAIRAGELELFLGREWPHANCSVDRSAVMGLEAELGDEPQTEIEELPSFMLREGAVEQSRISDVSSCRRSNGLCLRGS